MANLDRIIVGLQIIHKYEPNGDLAAEHDEIFAGSGAAKSKMSPEELERMEEGGWSFDDSLECFHHYT